MNKQIIKRVFITGPPGSFYSGFDNRLRMFLKDADNTDITPNRIYKTEGMKAHKGAYFNAGNEFGNWILNFSKYNREEITNVLDSVFKPQFEKKELIRFHKSHYFCYHIDQIKNQFPDATIVLLTNEPWKCILHWQRAGGFNTKYDRYPEEIYKNDYEIVWQQICDMNSKILQYNSNNHLDLQQFNKKFVFKYFPARYNKLFLEYIEDFTSPHTLYAGRLRYNASLLSTLKLTIV